MNLKYFLIVSLFLTFFNSSSLAEKTHGIAMHGKPKYEDGFWLDTSIEGSTFYITTGTHGAHVFIGLIALGYLIAKANKHGYNEEYNETI